jgi:uncharacterized membrane protein
MRSIRFLLAGLLMFMVWGFPGTALAQEGSDPTLSIVTEYPSVVVGIGETVNLDFDITSSISQTVQLEVENVPDGWTTEFRGGNRIVQAVYVADEETADVQLRVTPPDDVTGGKYAMRVVARGTSGRAEFPIELIVKDKVPAQLAFETEFPTVRGGSDTSFSFSTTLKNDGDEDITVTLVADAPKEFAMSLRSSGRDITNLPIDVTAGGSARIDITAEPLTKLPVGTYPITLTATAENLEITTSLTAEVTGQPQLTLTAPDERLSGDAYIGRSTPIKLVLRNTGNSPAAGVTLSASSPAGWTVTLDPEQVVEVPADGEVEVTAHVRPAERAVAGDYMITFRAQPNEGTAKSADFRITVRTSTLWGIVGVALIAVAVAIVGMAVVRFGRR